MNKHLLYIIILFFGSFWVSAQQFNLAPQQNSKKNEWKDMTPEERKQKINNMSHDERMSLMKEFREEMILSELNLNESEQEEFRTLYTEYQEKQKEIKNKFQSEKDPESLSDEEAKNQLKHSFEIGQQLLNNRKEYSEKFMKIMPPQKVLKLYETEGVIRNKIMDMKGSKGKSSPKRKP